MFMGWMSVAKSPDERSFELNPRSWRHQRSMSQIQIQIQSRTLHRAPFHFIFIYCIKSIYSLVHLILYIKDSQSQHGLAK
ncbi:hypothetical protein EYC80_007701 [Monilinia laxa]|uniref:Uncharacterized protein n=1 Tax=Monilinia laxa TaxID=61186 RepID=A0A5N6JWR1_MONLA|nr:hypothetical protein EYC80_007701 [Monilinia laxa]